jgi:ribosome-associated toxin RatA of RatAB toxin-antitoxin module
MARTDYHLQTRWELEATPQEVFDLIADAPSYPQWWPSVFLEARVVEPGDAHGVGRVVEVRTAAFLLIALSWRYRVTAVRPSERLAVETSGDLEGLGLWSFEPSDRRTVVRFNWRGRVTRPPFRQLPTFLRPLFRACHRWAMERGFTSLLLEVWRRRTDSQEARDWLPRPPGPAFPRNLRPWRPSGSPPPPREGSRAA